MNLLEAPWIPVRADAGRGESRLLTYRALLCEQGQNWQISLPRDDLELACLQLLVSMTQVIFLPDDDSSLRSRIDIPLAPDAFDASVAPYAEWFDLDHPTQPFMQTRGVKATDNTPIQKLLIGLPEGNNHAFFNDAGEVTHLGGTLVAIALFNQASNCPSFGGGFKGSLRGGAPITTLVFDTDLRRMIWRNVLSRERLTERQIAAPGPAQDQPTWVAPIARKSTIQWNQIGLVRGLFWQPAHVELVKSEAVWACDVLGGAAVAGYSGFRKEKFNFTVEGVWPHPHGAMLFSGKKEKDGKKYRSACNWKDEEARDWKFASFSAIEPPWTQLSEFAMPRSKYDFDAKEGSVPAGPISQYDQIPASSKLDLLIGGYQAKKALVLQRRHELIGIANGWQDDKSRLEKMVVFGKAVRASLYGKLMTAASGYENKKRKIKLKGLGVDLHKTAEKLFYARTEALIHQTFSNDLTWKQWPVENAAFVEAMLQCGREIFSELTQPYFAKPELIPIIAWTEQKLNAEFKKLKENTL